MCIGFPKLAYPTMKDWAPGGRSSSLISMSSNQCWSKQCLGSCFASAQPCLLTLLAEITTGYPFWEPLSRDGFRPETCLLSEGASGATEMFNATFQLMLLSHPSSSTVNYPICLSASQPFLSLRKGSTAEESALWPSWDESSVLGGPQLW